MFFFLFCLFDDSGHVQENSSMILNSGDFVYRVQTWSRQHEPTSIMANAQRKVMYRFWIYSTHGYDFLKQTHRQNLGPKIDQIHLILSWRWLSLSKIDRQPKSQNSTTKTDYFGNLTPFYVFEGTKSDVKILILCWRWFSLSKISTETKSWDNRTVRS